MVRAILATLAAGALLAGAPGADARDAVVSSFDGTPIVAHFYPARGLSAGQRVPTVLVGPGFAFGGDTDPDGNGSDVIGAATLRQAGYNVLTWDPRGFGGSGGTSMFDSPDFEARDVQALIGYVAHQPEALVDAPGDPRVGMSGSSYGGGIQLATAAIDERLDAIVPDIAWHSLPDALFRDGDVKAAVNTTLCGLGAANSVFAGLFSPAGVQTGSMNGHILSACASGAATGSISGADREWYAERGPGDALMDRIRTPTLLIQGTVDTLVPPGQAILNYAILRHNGVPVKMLWRCGGHGSCFTGDDPAYVAKVGLRWLDRWLKRDTSIGTGPRFEWRADDATWRSGPDYPLAPLAPLTTSSAGGRLAFNPTSDVGSGGPAFAGPAGNAVEVAFPPPPAGADLVGEPTVTITYTGSARSQRTYLYAQILDVGRDRIVDNQVTPLPVTLDGAQHTVTRTMEAISAHATAASRYRLQISPATLVYSPQRSIGSVDIEHIDAAMPVVDATRSGRARTAARRPAKPLRTTVRERRLVHGVYRLRLRSRLTAPPCAGSVTYRVAYGRAVETVTAPMSSACVAETTIRITGQRGTRVTVSSRFSGNDGLLPRSGRTVRKRLT